MSKLVKQPDSVLQGCQIGLELNQAMHHVLCILVGQVGSELYQAAVSHLCVSV